MFGDRTFAYKASYGSISPAEREPRSRTRAYWAGSGSLTGVNHPRTREIARYERQRRRDNANRLARGSEVDRLNGFGRSRRGNLIDCFPA